MFGVFHGEISINEKGRVRRITGIEDDSKGYWN